MSEQCEFCWSMFRTSKLLEQHHKTAKYCYDYRNVMFKCIKCDFFTRGIRNIERHIPACTENTIIQDEDQEVLETLQKRCLKLEDEIRNLTEKITEKKQYKQTNQELQVLVQVEKLKGKIYRNIISQNTTINVDDVFLENEALHVYNYSGGSIPVFVHEHCQNTPGLDISFPLDKKPVLPVKTRKTPKKPHYKKVPDNIPVQTTSKPKPKLKPIPKSNPEPDPVQDVHISDTIPDNNTEKIMKEIQKITENLKNTRVYTKSLNDLKILRRKILETSSLTSYHEMLMEHVKNVETLFSSKGYSDKKITSTISKELTPLEGRLLFYKGYTYTYLEPDEISALDKALSLTHDFPREHTRFDTSEVCKRFYNYRTAITPIKQLLVKTLVNPHGFWNIVYLKQVKSLDSDPYSFYVLKSCKKDKKCWDMNCRLEDVASTLVSSILPYMVSLFRKLYMDVFGDNEYRENYTSSAPVLECDAEQLVHNVIITSKPRDFCNLVRAVIKEKCTYTPELDNDKFNLYVDDAEQRKRFQEKETVDVIEIIKKLFDGITSEQAVDFYRVKNSSIPSQ